MASERVDDNAFTACTLHAETARRPHALARWFCALTVSVLISSGWAANARAQIAIDNVSSQFANATTLNFNHFIGGGADRLLILGIAVEGPNPANSDVTGSPTFNGVAFTKAIDNVTGTSFTMNTEIWYMLEAQLPVAGTYTVSITVGRIQPLCLDEAGIGERQ